MLQEIYEKSFLSRLVLSAVLKTCRDGCGQLDIEKILTLALLVARLTQDTIYLFLSTREYSVNSFVVKMDISSFVVNISCVKRVNSTS